MKQTIVPVPAGASTSVVPANSFRNYLGLMNTGPGDVNLGFGANAAVDSGWPLDAAPAAGRTGGGLTFSREERAPVNEIFAFSAAGTTLVVLEG